MKESKCKIAERLLLRSASYEVQVAGLVSIDLVDVRIVNTRWVRADYRSRCSSVRTRPRLLAAGAKPIPLSQGKFAIVDAADYEDLGQYKWCAIKGDSTYYAARRNGKKLEAVCWRPEEAVY